jgi:cytoskeletal protein CcmA (bactofilin family)
MKLFTFNKPEQEPEQEEKHSIPEYMSNYKETEPVGAAITRLAFGTELKDAVLKSEGDVRIDGKFSGKIETKGKLIIGDSAEIHGDVICLGAEISGKMEGNVFAGDCVTLKSTCVFKGVLNVTKLCIEKGAAFNGTCKMIAKDEFAAMSKDDVPEPKAAAKPETEPEKVLEEEDDEPRGKSLL